MYVGTARPLTHCCQVRTGWARRSPFAHRLPGPAQHLSSSGVRRRAGYSAGSLGTSPRPVSKDRRGTARLDASTLLGQGEGPGGCPCSSCPLGLCPPRRWSHGGAARDPDICPLALSSSLNSLGKKRKKKAGGGGGGGGKETAQSLKQSNGTLFW